MRFRVMIPYITTASSVFIRSSAQSFRREIRVPKLGSISRRFQTLRARQENAGTEISVSVNKTPKALPVWQRLGLLSRGIELYANSQRKRPYTTQFVFSLVIYFLGDLSAQKINGDAYDYSRMMRTLVISAGSSIPTYEWILFLGNNFNYASKLLSLAVKIIVNQVVFTPINNVWFFGMHSFLSGDPLPAIWQRLKDTVPTSIMNSCKLWPPITAFNLAFIHPEYRCIFAGFIAIGWQTYLSYLNRQSELNGLLERGSLKD